MKKIINCLLIGAIAIGFSSCEKYLDVNDNPNSPTSVTAELILPQAIVGSASVTNTFSQNLNFVSGSFANVGGVGGYGATLTQAYTTNSFNALWTSTYDNLQDYQTVISSNGADATRVYSTSIARIMKAYGFARLVDQYNDIPYSDALKGKLSLAPKYDKAEDVYKALITELDQSMAAITAGQAAPASAEIKVVAGSSDPLYKGDMNKWKKFANTLKLRMLVKMAGVPSLNAYAAPLFATLAATGFIDDDALVQPGYLKEPGRQSPNFASLASIATNVRSQGQATTTKWMLTFFNGNKINDPGRGSVIFRSFPSTPSNQLGDETSGAVAAIATYTAWFTGTNFDTPGLGVAKYSTQGQPIFLKAEADFLRAEAMVRNYLPGGTAGAATAFETGVKASYNYLYKDASDKVTKTPAEVDAWLATYKAANPASWLVNFGLAVVAGDYNADPTARLIEAISTQKYIALSNTMNDEAFNEYRRTGWPRTVTSGAPSPTLTFASRTSVATSPDKIITRILYPQQEYNLNASNVPANINLYTSKIFWDVN